MKHIRIIGSAATAVLALAAVIGVGTASATELYRLTSGAPADTLSKGTEIVGTLTGGTAKLTSTGGALLDTCTGGEVRGITGTAGSSTTTVSGAISALTWTGCTEPTETSVKGELEIHSKTNTQGTVTAKNTVVKVNTTVFEAICEYTVGSALDLGILFPAATSSGQALIGVNVVVPAKNSFFCPDARWEAEYNVTSPLGLVVETS
jgi:hypothetical protein